MNGVLSWPRYCRTLWTTARWHSTTSHLRLDLIRNPREPRERASGMALLGRFAKRDCNVTEDVNVFQVFAYYGSHSRKPVSILHSIVMID